MKRKYNLNVIKKLATLYRESSGEYLTMKAFLFNVASMPDLIDRVPDHIRIESSLAYGSSGNAYPGLDDRFKNNWGARFSGLIDVPESEILDILSEYRRWF